MHKAVRRLRVELRDLVEVVLVPGLAAVLPWGLCFALFKRLSHWRFLYRVQCDAALCQAQRRGWVGADTAAWLAARRLVTLVDHADLYLARTRSPDWFKRHMVVQGRWPAAGQPGLLFTFHWGAGMWGLRHLHAAGLDGRALMGNLNKNDFPGRTVFYQYIKARTQAVAAMLGHSPIDVSANLRPLLKALRQNHQVIAAIDVPADQVSASHPVDMLGLRARVPSALFRLAVEQGIPVTVFITGIQLTDGARFLRVLQLGVWNDLDALVKVVFGELEKIIMETPPAWHFWSEAERFFDTPE